MQCSLTYHAVDKLLALYRSFHRESHEIRNTYARTSLELSRELNLARRNVRSRILGKLVRSVNGMIDELTVIRKHFDLTQTKTSLNANELNGHVLTDKRSCTCERFRCTLIELSRVPSTQWIPLKICAAVPDSNLEILKWTLTAATASCNSDNSNRLRCQQIDSPPWRRFFLRL